MAFFAADNVMSWLSSPLMFYPFMLLLGVYAVIHSLGMAHIVIPIVKQTIWYAFRKLQIDRILKFY